MIVLRRQAVHTCELEFFPLLLCRIRRSGQMAAGATCAARHGHGCVQHRRAAAKGRASTGKQFSAFRTCWGAVASTGLCAFVQLAHRRCKLLHGSMAGLPQTL